MVIFCFVTFVNFYEFFTNLRNLKGISLISLMRNSTHDMRGFFLCGISKDISPKPANLSVFGRQKAMKIDYLSLLSFPLPLP